MINKELREKLLNYGDDLVVTALLKDSNGRDVIVDIVNVSFTKPVIDGDKEEILLVLE